MVDNTTSFQDSGIDGLDDADRDHNDAAMFAQAAYDPNDVGYRVRGLEFDLDLAGLQLSVSGGWAKLTRLSGQSAPRDGEPQVEYLDQVHPTQISGASVGLFENDLNRIWLVANLGQRDAAEVVVTTGSGSPAPPALEIAQVDTTAATAEEALTPLNRHPEGEYASLAVHAEPSDPVDAVRLTDLGEYATGDALDAVDAAKVETSTRDLHPEGPQTELAADATGVVYEGVTRQLLDDAIVNADRSVALETATVSSAGDETVTVELYDDTAAAVIGTVDVAGGSPRTRSNDLSEGLTAGNEVHVRWNVTTASATADATIDAIAARLVID